MENNINPVEKENTYLSTINKCRDEVLELRRSLNIVISCGIPINEKIATQNRTELEAYLGELLEMLKDLRRDIVM